MPVLRVKYTVGRISAINYSDTYEFHRMVRTLLWRVQQVLTYDNVESHNPCR